METLEMICLKHNFGTDGKHGNYCPYCSIAELEAKLWTSRKDGIRAGLDQALCIAETVESEPFVEPRETIVQAIKERYDES